jgi:tetratricopeptide (TPR) repeat protein
MRRVFASCAIVVFSLWTASALAHEGVNVQIVNLGKKIAQDPTNPSSYLERAALFRREKRFSAALDDLATAQRLAPDRRDIQLERGLTLAAKGDTKEAETLLSKYLESGLPSAKALVARANLRENSRRYAEARADYHAAISLEPIPDTFLARGRMDEALGHWDDAARGYEEGLRLLSGAVVLRLALIHAEHHRGQYDRAITLIDEILPNLPVKADWLLLRADQHAAAGRAEKARQDRLDALHEAETRLKKRPTDFAHIAHAKALHALQRHEEASSELDAVVEHAPKLEEARILRDEIRRSVTRKR